MGSKDIWINHRFCQKLNYFGHNWTHLVKFGHIWQILVIFCQILLILANLSYINIYKICQILAKLNQNFKLREKTSLKDFKRNSNVPKFKEWNTQNFYLSINRENSAVISTLKSV